MLNAFRALLNEDQCKIVRKLARSGVIVHFFQDGASSSVRLSARLAAGGFGSNIPQRRGHAQGFHGARGKAAIEQ